MVYLYPAEEKNINNIIYTTVYNDEYFYAGLKMQENPLLGVVAISAR
jgi:hypothetical protein